LLTRYIYFEFPLADFPHISVVFTGSEFQDMRIVEDEIDDKVNPVTGPGTTGTIITAVVPHASGEYGPLPIVLNHRALKQY